MKTTENSPPDMGGAYAKAWKIDLAECRKNPEDGSIAAWIVNCPQAHPFWSNYMVSMVHLRPIADSAYPIHLYLEGATHEICVVALDPDDDPQPVEGTGWRYLTPVNYAGQMKLGSDAEAIAVCDNTVADICAGQLNPDTDAVSQWIRRFGNHMFKA